MRFRPENIRVINCRVCSWAVVGPAVPNRNPLKAHQRERVPAPPPVNVSVDARTVLAVKGSLRRAKNGRALDCSAPFRPDRHRDGRLRREHFPSPRPTQNKKPAFLVAEEAGLKTNPSKNVGLDRSLHIRT